jgi:hypothetical protein
MGAKPLVNAFDMESMVALRQKPNMFTWCETKSIEDFPNSKILN